MFKNSVISIRTMSSERKIKEKLTKRLSGRKLQKIEPAIEQADTASQFFKENKEKTNKPPKIKSKKVSAEPELSKKIIVAKKTQVLVNDTPLPVVQNESLIKSIFHKPNDEITPSIELKKPKSLLSSKSSTKNKAQVEKNDEPSTSKKVKQELLQEKWQPINWETILNNIRKMRSDDKAPVDTMGCHKCADENANKKTQRYHKLIALMLSSQTKDEITYHAMLRLRENNLTPEIICNMKVNVLENILHPVSFYKNKAKYIQQTSKILIEKYDSDIPNNIKELVGLPGVGPKMAHICMATAWNEVTGIGVDVHVHRISNRIGWLPKPTKEPEKTRMALESWLPKYLWREVNHLLVGFGQTTCTPVKPKCGNCLNFKICPSAVKISKKEVTE